MVSGVVSVLFPKKPPPPTVLFGPLPAIPFPENRADPSKLKFTLETAERSLPKLPTQSAVYYMPKDVATLSSVDEGLQKAKGLGFSGQGEKVTETLYRFRHPSLPKTLEINIVSKIFSLSYDLALDPTPIDAIPPTPEIAASYVRSYLAGADLLPEDLTGPTTHRYLKVEQGKLVPAISQSEAQIIEINLFRSNFDELPSIGEDVGEANVWFLVSGSRLAERRILSGEFRYFPVDAERISTYPIKTSEQAWEDLANGKVYIAKSPPEGEVVIRRVYLANYDPSNSAEFFQPIIVFEGDNFAAYVPAVTDEYYGQ